MRLIGFAAEPMDAPTLKRLREKISPNVVQMYGSTETGAAASCITAEEMIGERLVSVGRPMLNGDLRVVVPGGGLRDEVAAAGEMLVLQPLARRRHLARSTDDRRHFRQRRRPALVALARSRPHRCGRLSLPREIGGGFGVHVIDANAVFRDHPQPLRGLHDAAGDRRVANGRTHERDRVARRCHHLVLVLAARHLPFEVAEHDLAAELLDRA